MKKNNFIKWRENIITLHKTKEGQNPKSRAYKRLVFDEICANLLVLSKNRKKIKKKKRKKIFRFYYEKKIINNLAFKLTNSQKSVLRDINNDLISETRMFRIIQGDVGSGKTIVSLLAAGNVIESNYQCALMAPTEILAKQHFILTKKIFKNTNIKVEILTGKTERKKREKIINDLETGNINFLIGTHSLFQKKN